MPCQEPMISISGLRGIVGQSLDSTTAAKYAIAFGTWIKESAESTPDNGRPPSVVLGRDSRRTGEMLHAATRAGLLDAGCDVVDIGIQSTPATAVAVEHLGAAGGIVITASHNPAPWNGLKPLRQDGTAPPPNDFARIRELLLEHEPDTMAHDAIGSTRIWEQAVRVHVEKVLARLDVQAIRDAGFRVLIDSVHGAGGAEALQLCNSLGIAPVHHWAQPTGRFPHPPEPTEASLQLTADKVRQAKVDIAFVQDPDADRLAVLAPTGRYIGEEYTLALAAMSKLGQGQTLVTNLSTSRMVEDIAKQTGGKVVRTPVGEANVAQAIREHDAVLGGEGNGGVIDPQVTFVRDSILAMGLILEAMATNNKTLEQLVESVPSYSMIKRKQSIEGLELEPCLSRVEQKLNNEGASVDRRDGVHVSWADRWVHVRASNTEPIVRIIAEAPTQQDAEALCDAAGEAIAT